MRFFSRSKQHGVRIALIFDIGSASVGGALVLLRPAAKPHVLYHVRKYMVFQQEFNFNRFLSSMLSSLDEVARDMEQRGLSHVAFTEAGHRRIDHILCSYASPWYLSQTRMVTITKKKPFVLTHDMVDRMLREQEKELSKDGATHYSPELSEHLEIIERTVTNIKLNGYTLDVPYGKEASAVQFSLSTAAMARELRERVEATIEKIFRARQVTHHSFALIGFHAITRHLDAPKDFLIVDVSGEVTDIALVYDGALLESVSFPQGARMVLRELNRGLHVSADEGRTLLALHQAGTVGRNSASALERLLAGIEETWHAGFSNALRTLDRNMVIPKHVFLTADERIIGLFQSFIESESWAQKTRTAGAFAVTPVTGGVLASVVAFRGQTANDPFIALAALYLDSAYPVVY